MFNASYLAFLFAAVFACGALAGHRLGHWRGKKKNRALVIQANFHRRRLVMDLQMIEAQNAFLCGNLSYLKAKLERAERELAMMSAGAVAISNLN